MHEAHKKKFKKLLKDRKFVFCITVYPIALIIYIAGLIYISSKRNANDFLEFAMIYTVVSLVILGFISVMTIFEKIEKRASYKVQGDKLKLKRNEKNWKD